jgi:hypothetical protein
VAGYAALTVLSGEWDANDERASLQPAQALIRQADALGIPVLEHCLGGHLRVTPITSDSANGTIGFYRGHALRGCPAHDSRADLRLAKSNVHLARNWGERCYGHRYFRNCLLDVFANSSPCNAVDGAEFDINDNRVRGDIGIFRVERAVRRSLLSWWCLNPFSMGIGCWR